MLLSFLVVTVQPANASYPNSKAEVYSSYWYQLDEEKAVMPSLTSTIQSYFSSVGYDTGRYCGTDTNSIVYANIQYDQQNYDRVAVFHYGHMADAGNYRCSDDSIVNWTTIYDDYTTNGYADKHYFAMIWACNSADREPDWVPDPSKLAKSWSHRSGMSSDGFNNADTNHGDCFIGFDHASPTLTYAIYNTTTVHGFDFIQKFYWYALTQGGYSVHDALDQASLTLFSLPFDETPLWTGCYTYYPPLTDDFECSMEVFGNSHIYLRQYYPYYHEQSIVWGAGAANNPTNVHGPAPDGTYTQLWGGNPGDGGAVVSLMTGSAGDDGGGFSRGHIYLYGYSVSGYYSHLYVYVSQNNNNDWQLVNQGYITSSTPTWYDIGQAPSNFRYVAIVGIDDDGWSCNLMVDAVRAIP